MRCRMPAAISRFANVEAGTYKLIALVSGQSLERTIEVTGPRTEVTVSAGQ